MDVSLWRDSASLSCLVNHSQPFVEAPFIVELSQIGSTIHLDAVLHMRVTTHQGLHVPHVKLF